MAELLALRDELVTAERDRADDLAAVHDRHRPSAVNLVHYVALRRHDVRGLQLRLAAHGLSSLGRAESSVLAQLDAVLNTLACLAGVQLAERAAPPVGIGEGDAILERNARDLLGPPPEGRDTRIMVTMPSTAAFDAALVETMSTRGMDVARVNCAHDDEAAWEQMIHHVRRAAVVTGRPCRVAMDLAGPKLRTGPIAPGPKVLRVSPTRDQLGQVIEPASVWLTPIDDEEAMPGTPTITVDDPGWSDRRRPGDVIELHDTRHARRRLKVLEVHEHGCLASIEDTTYFGTGVVLRVDTPTGADTARVGDLPELAQYLLVRPGDHLVLTRDLAPATMPQPGETPRIGCTLPEAFTDAAVGEPLLLDDGKIAGTIVRTSPDELELEIVRARPTGTRLRAEKGINLPDTNLRTPAITDKDREDLAFVAAHADIVNASFVRFPSDVADLQERLAEVRGEHLGIVLKIENRAGFEHLPDLLLQAMRSERIGVMIARGDLAVEVGYERLAEVQLEILWLCEAAHTPVIWATQVLEQLARKGRPSRAEVTDAAMAERAECVMLNKGPYIESAISSLDGILRRMEHHQDKKRNLLRRLRAWDRDD